MLELIAFALFQIATFGNHSATASAQTPVVGGYEANYGNIEFDAASRCDTVRIHVSGNGGWGHD